MNNYVEDFLNQYIKIDDPQYAIFINGCWGCGKTFFIHKWMKHLKNSTDNCKNLKWNPIYVSLYGLTKTQQITEKINEEIYPWLYSKGAKIAKMVLKTASKAVLRCNIDCNNDEHDEGSITYNLDSILLLKGENSNISGSKILIFDDVERCGVKLDILLGYINYFSEHCRCKVIIIGDEEKITLREGQNSSGGDLKFKDFKEKTIGRTFKINADLGEAVDYFINTISSNEKNLLNQKKDLIKEVFKASGSSNLRVLRQCLIDYNNVVAKIPEYCINSLNYNKIASYLIANFVAVYCEYKNGYTQLYNLFETMHSLFLKPEAKSERERLLSKYRYIGIRENIAILDSSMVEEIIKYLETGHYNIEYIENFFTAENLNSKSWDNLFHFWILNNENYKQYYDDTIKYFLSDKIDDAKELFTIISTLSLLYNEGLIGMSNSEQERETILIQGKKLIDRILCSAENAQTVLSIRERAIDGIRRSCFVKELNNSILNELFKYLDDLCNAKMNIFPNKVSEILENLTDSVFTLLEDLLNQVDPFLKTYYKDTAIFEKINAEKVANGIIRLSNQCKTELYYLLANRYLMPYSDSVNKDDVFNADIPNLSQIRNLLNEKCEKIEFIDKYNIKRISQLIGKVVDAYSIK